MRHCCRRKDGPSDGCERWPGKRTGRRRIHYPFPGQQQYADNHYCWGDFPWDQHCDRYFHANDSRPGQFCLPGRPNRSTEFTEHRSSWHSLEWMAIELSVRISFLEGSRLETLRRYCLGTTNQLALLMAVHGNYSAPVERRGCCVSARSPSRG